MSDYGDSEEDNISICSVVEENKDTNNTDIDPKEMKQDQDEKNKKLVPVTKYFKRAIIFDCSNNKRYKITDKFI